MNLKYYLRGLGLGIIITAIILAVGVKGKKETISDEEIVARAKELGMIENTVLSAAGNGTGKTLATTDAEESPAGETEPASTLAEEGETSPTKIAAGNTLAEEDSEQGTDETTADEAGINENNTEVTDGDETLAEEENHSSNTQSENTSEQPDTESKTPSADGENTESETQNSTEDNPTQFIIQAGEAPSSISERLEEGGWITDAEEFTVFLVNNGYDTVIVAAEYDIPLDADMDAIARIITKNKIVRRIPTQPEIPTVPETPPAVQ